MATIIIFACFGAILYIEFGYSSDILEYIWDGIKGFFLGAILGFIVALMIPNETKFVLKETHPLIAVSIDNQNGFFSPQNGYYCMFDKGEGFLVTKFINIDDIILKYTTDTSKIEIYTDKMTTNVINLFSVNFTDYQYIIYSNDSVLFKSN